MQLLYNGANHWLLSVFSGNRVLICDSLYEHVTVETAKQPKLLYAAAHDERGKLPVTLPPVQRRSNCDDCDLFAIAFAADLLHDFSVMESHFDEVLMRTFKRMPFK